MALTESMPVPVANRLPTLRSLDELVKPSSCHAMPCSWP